MTNSSKNKQKSSTCSRLFLVFRNQLVDRCRVVLHLSSDLRVVFEGKHQRSDRPSVRAAD